MPDERARATPESPTVRGAAAAADAPGGRSARARADPGGPAQTGPRNRVVRRGPARAARAASGSPTPRWAAVADDADASGGRGRAVPGADPDGPARADLPVKPPNPPIEAPRKQPPQRITQRHPPFAVGNAPAKDR
ncbi:hypothetical protein GCM10010103_24480 [Streptomyces paradoxus]|uniref:Uncharacterized protein n=1 Tax=Streptomyces paradoxus TaxID=66375 RepID=A0A7W9WFA4_9ACTN|nr:hypothetical protein [Streptomyces paradoxus]MBB6076507.1 hypothetical protein [Streptomyces paradoxus]